MLDFGGEIVQNIYFMQNPEENGVTPSATPNFERLGTTHGGGAHSLDGESA